MRTMQIVLGCLAAAAIVLLPALALAETAGKTPAPTAPGKVATPAKGATTAVYTPGSAAARSKAPAKVATPDPSTIAPAAPVALAVPPSPAAPAFEPLPPLPPLAPLTPPATSPKATAPAAPAPAAPGVAPSKGAALPAVPAAAPPSGEPLPIAPKPAFPYSGYINADSVRIRSGPGLYYYQLAILNNNAPVVVENEADGWLALRPSAGVYGLMKKSDLAIAPDGKKAAVSAPTARIYAASESANRHWSVMATLKDGDAVQVLGPADGDLVKIAPPESAHVYVVSQYVQAGTGTGGANTALLNMTELPKVDPLVEDFKKANSALDAEQKKPLGDRDFASATAAFKEIAEKTDKFYLRRAAEEQLARINTLEKQQAGYLKVLAISDRLDKNLAEIRAQEAAKTAQAERDKKIVKVEFVATGLVAPLESMEDVDYPIKYKLVDQNNHPLVVLKSSTYDLSKYVGMVVGVRGAKTYLKDWRIYLVTVDDLEVIE
jgi:SH3-like domain-containing protein